MTLSDHDIELVQTSFKQFSSSAEMPTNPFYKRLFALDPSLRVLFPDDLTDQKVKLMQMLGVVVAGLKHLDEIIPALHALGARHVGYGVELAHYDTVGKTLLWTLEEALGESFTPEVKAAWQKVYDLVAEIAQEGATEN